MLGVKYYVAYSPAIIAQANRDPDLTLIAQTKAWPTPGVTWKVYEISKSPMVVALKTLPNVVSGISSRVGWLDANETWWLTPKLQSTVAATSGPSNWPRSSSITAMNSSKQLPKVVVSNVVVGDQNISFHVDKIGVPVLVKISYFPRWHATGATGPYRVSPNLMVVVPTSNNVSLVYGSTPYLTIGNIISDAVTLGGFVYLVFFIRRRRLARN
jgi:hypothetical protein